MAPTFSEADSQLVSKMHSISKKNPRLIKSSTYPAPAEPNIIVRSWKMNEFKYYDVPSPFPTLARGIFTIELDPTRGDREETEDDRNKRYRIVARGYDKFFNIGEVPWCTWPALQDHTAPPYVLSLKSNGCIIFIAALTSSKLLVTSKHSIGPVQGVPLSHAQAGESWLHRYLEEKGRTEADLASVLWENNWTAVAELCDDSFEEHVLAYPPEKTGLHLHGLNSSSKEFATLPPSKVDAFAEEWGFIKTPTITFETIDEVKSFTTEVGRTGKWNGEPVEGFVVRTTVASPPSGSKEAKSPYAPGSSFFFKVKFDEPYMMYRDWREVTKSLLSPKGPLSAAKLPKSKMKRPETKLYVKWVIEEIKKNRAQFDGFNKGKGIIATRERFLKWIETEQGKKDLEKTKKYDESTVTILEDGIKEFQKTIIVPVAIPGCGKTAVAVALSHIFGFAHTQSDDIQGKRPAPQFIKNVANLLKTKDVVIADKNNHLRQHRTALREVASAQSVPTRLLALNWAVTEKPQATIHRVCGDRVSTRGDNHQTLRVDTTATKSHEEVIWMFINQSEELADAEVDAVVEMDVEADLEASVRRAVEGVVKVLGCANPSEEKVKEALEVVRAYKPKVVQPDKKSKDAGLRYYGLLPEFELEEVLGERFVADDDEDASERRARAHAMFEGLKNGERLTKRPHVTVVHKNSLPGERKLWDACVKLNELQRPPLFKARLGHLVWNDRVMALTVDDLDLDDSVDTDQEVNAGKKWLEELGEELKERLHITVGTMTEKILPVEAKDLLESWRRSGDTAKIHSLELGDVPLRGRLKGLYS